MRLTAIALLCTLASAAPVPGPVAVPPPVERITPHQRAQASKQAPAIPAEPTKPDNAETSFLPSDSLRAQTMLFAPVQTPESFGDLNTNEAKRLRAALYALAIELEIMDPRECPHYFRKGDEETQRDIDILRARLEELRDVPMISEARRFPPKKVVQDIIALNREFKRNLEERLVWESDRADLITIAINETDQLYYYWDGIRDFQNEFYYVTTRRGALLKSMRIHKERRGHVPSVPEWAVRN